MIDVRAPNKIRHNAFKVEYTRISKTLVSPVKVCDVQNKNIVDFHAIWDTGATNSVITKRVVDSLNIIPIGVADVFGVNSVAQRPVYRINLILPNSVGIEKMNVTESDINSAGVDLLIGMDIICLGDFAISNHAGKTTFSFSVPPHHNIIDLVERSLKINRNR